MKFTPDQLKQMREGKSLLEIMREQKAAQTAAAQALIKEVPGAPAPEAEGEEGDDKKPGKVAGRNQRHADRAKRAEKRKTFAALNKCSRSGSPVLSSARAKSRSACRSPFDRSPKRSG
jgi:hypothetical protein